MDPIETTLYAGMFIGVALVLVFGWLLRPRLRPQEIKYNVVPYTGPNDIRRERRQRGGDSA